MGAGTVALALRVLCGLEGVIMLSPGCSSSSGTLPAASRSNTLSVSCSWGDLSGAAGSGLFTSDGVGGLCLDGDDSEVVAALGVGLDTGGLAPPSGPFASPPVAGLINFPCRELGGGGFFFTILGAGCRVGFELLTNPRRSSSASRAETSADVRGVSCTVCNISEMECRELEDVSAVLAPSPPGVGRYLVFWEFDAAGDDRPRLPAWPVSNNRPNAPTSSAPLAVAGAVAELCSGSDTPVSKSRRVF